MTRRGSNAGQQLGRDLRLRRNSEVRGVRVTGRKAESGALALFIRAAAGEGPGPSRFAVSVGRRLGNAVVRNRLRRLLRESWRRRRRNLTISADVLCVARTGAGRITSFARADAALGEVLSKAGLA